MGPLDSVIKTKLCPSARIHDALKRSVLAKLLNKAHVKNLILVHAPAGYGKTTLLYQWYKAMADKSQLVCWLSIDEMDDDPVKFVRYLLCSYREVVKDFCADAANWMDGRIRPDGAVILNHIVNELVRLERPITLFIDDYHHINSPEIHQFVERLIDWAPQHFLLVISSRVMPPISLSKWRVSEGVIEVDVNMLRFNDREVAAFLRRRHELQLSEEQISAISGKSEGWVTGLQLVAIALKHCENIDDFIASFSGNIYEITDYLMQNVLMKQPQELTDFLLKTSILSRFNAEICNLLTEREDAQSTLEQLESEGLFTLPIDRQREWYRYHHLFRDFLISRLRRQIPHEMLNLYQTAAHWFRDHGYINEAVDYALLSNDLNMIAEIHKDAVAILSLIGDTSRVYDWVRSIPDSIKEKFPRLLIIEGIALGIMNRIEEAELIQARLEQAVRNLAEDESTCDLEELTCLEREAIVVPAMIAVAKDDNTELLTLTAHTDEESVDNLMTAVKLDIRGYALFRHGRFSESKQFLIKAWQYYSINKEFYGMALVDSFTGMVDMQMLEYRDAEQSFSRAGDAMGAVGGENRFARALACTMRATVCYEWNRLEEAMMLLSSNLSLVENHGLPIFSCYGYTTLSRCYSAQGDYDKADRVLGRCLVISNHCVSNLFSEWVAKERLMITWRVGKSGRRSFDYKEPRYLTTESLPEHWDLAVHLALSAQIRLSILEGKMPEAMSGMEVLREYAEKHRAPHAILECLLLKAQILALGGRPDLATPLVLDAVKLAKPAGLLRTFVDEGKVLREILEQCLDTESMSRDTASYIAEILAAYNAAGGGCATGGPFESQSADCLIHVEALSKRELQVLDLIAAGKTNAEIAENLFISNATVKFHIGNIFSKLSATNRTRAVAIARSKGFIS